MRKNNSIIYIMLSLSMGYLIYKFIFTEYSYGMMSHHYGYYDNYSGFEYYLHGGLTLLAYSTIVIGVLLLISKSRISNNNAYSILDQRLSKGELSIEEYQKIKDTIQK